MLELKDSDSAVYSLVQGELERQKDVLNMIPSENYVSKAVLEATGSVLCNKYSEGYAKRRYYQGNQWID
ncbi:MAG: serine hydroxymethyltransferase, partial [Candidatus Nanoarchaeia archaeon]|nr:serine hydroxymethyltransferase [Candidatus Nanoarchaeia archaeon]